MIYKKIKNVYRIFVLSLFMIFKMFFSVYALDAGVPLYLMAGQMIMSGFHGTDIGSEWMNSVGEQIREGYLGGVILFDYNIPQKEEFHRLTSYLKSQSWIPLLIAIDQEGGRVSRLDPKKGYGKYPSHKAVGELSIEEAKKIYGKMAAELRKYGVNLNLAPVVDIDYNPTSPAIGAMERSFSKDPDRVMEYAKVFIDAHENEGLLTALKHFPGQGRSIGDTHNKIEDLTGQWKNDELIPFINLTLDRDTVLIMTAHTYNKEIDPDYPATLSKPTIDSLLRQENVDVAIISDDLQMGAIQENYTFEETVVGAVNAGVDILLFSNNPRAWPENKDFEPDPYVAQRAVEIILAAVKDGRIEISSLENSFRRIMKIKENIGKKL